MGRSPCCDKANVKKGPWSAEEDAKLKDFIHKHGNVGNWITLPKKAGLKRCGKSCRLRWLNYLRPNIKHGEFTDEEDRLIFSLYSTIGSRWSIIASQLPGRTDNDIKNHWNTKLKKKLMNMILPTQRNPQTSVQYGSDIAPNCVSQFYHDFQTINPIPITNSGFKNLGSVPYYPPENLTRYQSGYMLEQSNGEMGFSNAAIINQESMCFFDMNPLGYDYQAIDVGNGSGFSFPSDDTSFGW